MNHIVSDDMVSPHHQPSRRMLLAGLSAAASMSAMPAFARAPMANVQAPAYHRFKIGAFEATIVSDGPLALGEPKEGVFSGYGKAEFTKVLTDNFLPTDNVELDQNILLLNTGTQLVLFDTGDGGSKMFGAKSGRLLPNLKAAGIDPKDIDAVVLTHAHPDHCWGLMSADGARVFPNAQIYMSQADFDFWTGGEKAPAELKPMFDGTRKQLMPNRERMVFVRDGQEFLPGIQAMSAPGHTVGHTVYMITSQGKTVCNAGDTAHHHVISTQNPRAVFAFDSDGNQAVASRLRIFDMLATRRLPVLAYHFPWPGLGYLARQGDAYRYVAAPMQTVL